MRDVKRDPEAVLNTLCRHSNDPSYRFERLYRTLFNEQMFYIAYQRIYAKPGNMTPGTDGRTIDQMSIERVEKLIVALRDESYKPHPARRVYIPKKSGDKRPLGIPSFEDKLVQEVIRLILEAIYEGYFEDTSHGFRPQRSCHTALREIKIQFKGTRWFIEGDIKGFFDNIDHTILIDTLRERIADERFLRLIRKFLNAGYIENWKFNNTYSGTPQGGIISPILANIYLDKFDKYVAEYAQKFNCGKSRRLSPEYQRNRNQRNALRWKLEKETDESHKAEFVSRIAKLRKEMLTLNCGQEMDEKFRRLKYVRYADDFLIGVVGTKAECEVIKADIAQYMSDRLRLELSKEKTLITNAQKEAKFLGYEITTLRSQVSRRTKDGIVRRPFTGNVKLKVPMQRVKDRLKSYDAMTAEQVQGKEILKPTPRRYMVGRKVEDILAQYNSEIRGFYNYYAFADNIGYAGWKFNYFMEYSMYKTMACKLNSTIGGVKDKYRRGKDFVIPYVDSKGRNRCRVLYNGGFRKHKMAYEDAICDNIPNTMFTPQPTLVERLMERHCEMCGAEGKTVMHHVRTLTTLKGENQWDKLMLNRHRKTLAVCESCNAKIQSSTKGVEKQ